MKRGRKVGNNATMIRGGAAIGHDGITVLALNLLKKEDRFARLVATKRQRKEIIPLDINLIATKIIKALDGRCREWFRKAHLHRPVSGEIMA